MHFNPRSPRKRRRMTQQALASRGGVQTSTVWRTEKGKTKPHKSTVKRLKRALRSR